MSQLSNEQVDVLAALFHSGAAEATKALSTWLGRNVSVTVDQVEQLPFEETTESLGPAESTLCACVMGITGGMRGQILFCFDDASGLSLCDLLLGREQVSVEWGELEQSSALETANIVGCAYLNSLSSALPVMSSRSLASATGFDSALVPTPPLFVRDFAASIMEFAIMNQALEFDTILVAQTKFQIDGRPFDWSLLLIPDSQSLEMMKEALG